MQDELMQTYVISAENLPMAALLTPYSNYPVIGYTCGKFTAGDTVIDLNLGRCKTLQGGHVNGIFYLFIMDNCGSKTLPYLPPFPIYKVLVFIYQKRLFCTLQIAVLSKLLRGRILGRNPDKSLGSFPPWYSQSPLLLLP